MEKHLTYKVDINHLFHLNPFYNIFTGERWDETAAGVGAIVTDYLKANPLANLGNLIDFALNDYVYGKAAAELIKKSMDKSARYRGASSLLIQMIIGGSYNVAPPELCVNGYLPETTVALPLFGRDYWDEAGTELFMHLGLLVIGRKELEELQQKFVLKINILNKEKPVLWVPR